MLWHFRKILNQIRPMSLEYLPPCFLIETCFATIWALQERKPSKFFLTITFTHISRSWVSLRTYALVITVYQSTGTWGAAVAVVSAFIRSYRIYLPHRFIRILKITEKTCLCLWRVTFILRYLAWNFASFVPFLFKMVSKLKWSSLSFSKKNSRG